VIEWRCPKGDAKYPLLLVPLVADVVLYIDDELLLLLFGPEGESGGRTSAAGGTAEFRRELDADESEYFDRECNGSSLSEADEMIELARDELLVAAAADARREYGNVSSSWRGRRCGVGPGADRFGGAAGSGVCGSTVWLVPLADELKADDAVLSVYAELNTTGGAAGGGGGMAMFPGAGAGAAACGGGGGGGGMGCCWERWLKWWWWSAVECMFGSETRCPTDGYE
jgi:hypothetical protein